MKFLSQIELGRDMVGNGKPIYAQTVSRLSVSSSQKVEKNLILHGLKFLDFTQLRKTEIHGSICRTSCRH